MKELGILKVSEVIQDNTGIRYVKGTVLCRKTQRVTVRNKNKEKI
jgi:hypothetical protein